MTFSGTFQAFLSPLLGGGFYDVAMAIKDTVRGSVAMPRPVYVLATTEAGTAVAIQTARQLAADDDAALLVLVPHVVPYGTELGNCGHNLSRLGEPYRDLALASGVNATIRVCACRDARHIFSLLLIDRAQVVIAGRRRSWWPSRDERLARALECEGHQVVFVDLEESKHRSADAVPAPNRPRLRLVTPPTALATPGEHGLHSGGSANRRPLRGATRKQRSA
jgi:hypothetical protein